MFQTLGRFKENIGKFSTFYKKGIEKQGKCASESIKKFKKIFFISSKV